MPPTFAFVGAGAEAVFSAGNLSPTGDTAVVALPAGVLDGDILLFVVTGYTTGGGTFASTFGAGTWTIDDVLYSTAFNGGTQDGIWANTALRVAASEPASYSITCTRTGASVFTVHGRILAYRDWSAGVPPAELIVAGNAQAAASLTETQPTFANTFGAINQGLVYLTFGAQSVFASVPTVTPPGTVTVDFANSYKSSGSWIDTQVSSELWTTAPAYPSRAFTITPQTTPDDLVLGLQRFHIAAPVSGFAGGFGFLGTPGFAGT